MFSIPHFRMAVEALLLKLIHQVSVKVLKHGDAEYTGP